MEEFNDWLGFWKRVEKIPNGCWIWNGGRNRKGYGTWPYGDRPKVGVHVYAYQKCVGPVPAGFEIDHLCRIPFYVNPKHLEAVTGIINNQRSNSATAINLRTTHCRKAGHPLAGNNLYVRPDGKSYRECLACRRIRAKNYYSKRRQV